VCSGCGRGADDQLVVPRRGRGRAGGADAKHEATQSGRESRVSATSDDESLTRTCMPAPTDADCNMGGKLSLMFVSPRSSRLGVKRCRNAAD